MPRAAARQNLSTDSDDDRLTSTLLTLNVLYQTHIHPNLPEQLQPVSNTISSILVNSAPYLSQLISIARSLISNVTNSTQDGSGLLSVGILLVTMYMGLKMMNYIRRTIFGWVWFAVKLLLILFAVQIGFYINSVGLERAMTSVGWIGSVAWSMAQAALEQDPGQQRQPRGTRRRGQNNPNVQGRYY